MVGITVQNLSKSFGDVIAVNDVSLSVGAEELLVLVGPSGCGKTTLLRLIAGLERADTGQILFGERMMNEIRPKHRNIGFVFQNYALLPQISVYENIAYGLRSRRVPSAEIENRVNAAATKFRIGTLLKRYPEKLSGGERQRVALARALVRETVATLYDEPLANLDAPLRQQARADIMQLHRQKQQPGIYVTHDQEEALALGHRIAIMQKGRIVQLDTPSQIYTNPSNRFVADFVGAGINWFDAETFGLPMPEGARHVGVRAESWRMVSAESALVSGVVTVGNGRYNQFETPDRKTISFYTTNPLNVGEQINLTVGIEDTIWFDSFGDKLNT